MGEERGGREREEDRRTIVRQRGSNGHYFTHSNFSYKLSFTFPPCSSQGVIELIGHAVVLLPNLQNFSSLTNSARPPSPGRPIITQPDSAHLSEDAEDEDPRPVTHGLQQNGVADDRSELLTSYQVEANAVLER